MDCFKNNKRHVVLLNLDFESQTQLSGFLDPADFHLTALTLSVWEEMEARHHKEWALLILNPSHFSDKQIAQILSYKEKNPFLPILALKTSTNTPSSFKQMNHAIFQWLELSWRREKIQKILLSAYEHGELSAKATKIQKELQALSPKERQVIGKSSKFLHALEIARKAAASKANILITGESGTGKEIFAKFIHDESPVQKGPLVAINCSAIPDHLLESELFGHAKGSFTGAQERRIGLFEEAQNGTLFLDEIGDLDLHLQSKILRVLQEKKVKRIGENNYRSINCRIISATNRDLRREIQDHRFREDLFFRLDVVPIALPPLRERKDDILRLAMFFLTRYTEESPSQPPKSFSFDALKYLYEHDWKGNIRELENTIERAIVLSEGPEITKDDFIPESDNPPSLSPLIAPSNESFYVDCQERLPPLEHIVQKYIEFAVSKTGGARDKAAREIGIDRKTLYKRLKVSESLKMPLRIGAFDPVFR